MNFFSSLALRSNDVLLSIFHKEALFIFVMFCLMVFFLALIVAKWAYDDGQFSGLEESKFEVLED